MWQALPGSSIHIPPHLPHTFASHTQLHPSPASAWSPLHLSTNLKPYNPYLPTLPPHTPCPTHSCTLPHTTPTLPHTPCPTLPPPHIAAPSPRVGLVPSGSSKQFQGPATQTSSHLLPHFCLFLHTQLHPPPVSAWCPLVPASSSRAPALPAGASPPPPPPPL